MTQKKLTTVFVIAVSTGLLLAPSALTRVTAQARQAPIFQVDPTWPALPNNWVLGTVTSVTVGKDDHVWIVHRPRTVAEPKRTQAAPPVLEYDAAGKFVKAWGGDGQGYDWPAAEHGISADYKGNLWFTGSSPSGGSPDGPVDNMILKFSRDGRFLLQIGGRNQPGGNKDTKNVERATDVDVYHKTNEAFVADGYGNRRVIVFDADTGAYKRHWGAYGRPPTDDKLPPYDPAAAVTQQFSNPVHCVKLAKDGLVYVCDRINNRIQVFHKDGSFVTEWFYVKQTRGNGGVWDLAIWADQQQSFLFTADGENNEVRILKRADGMVLGAFGRSGRQAGQFHWVHNLAIDSKGDIYTTEVDNGKRVQKFRPTEMPAR